MKVDMIEKAVLMGKLQHLVDSPGARIELFSYFGEGESFLRRVLAVLKALDDDNADLKHTLRQFATEDVGD